MTTHAVHRLVEDALQRHGRGVVGFSGGRDSVVLRHFLRDFADRLVFVWVNPGAALPHMEAFVRAQGVVELQSDQAGRFAALGLPSRVVPIFNTPNGRDPEPEPAHRAMLADWVACCRDLRFAPTFDYLGSNRITLLVHGQRRAEGHQKPFEGAPFEAIGPLWDWSDEEVSDYAERHQLPLPEQYGMGYASSIECWNCTAAVTPAKFAYMAKRYPEHWKVLRSALDAVYAATETELDKYKAALEATEAA